MPANPPVSPFLQFAATFERFRSNDTDVRNIYGLAPLLRQAERHARLLAQIEQFANEPQDISNDDFYDGYGSAKAHIKALLEQP